MARRALGAGRSGLALRASPWRGAPARGGRALRPRPHHQRFRRPVQGQHATAGCHALPGSAARGAARQRHPPLRRPPATDRTRRCVRHARPVGGRAGEQIRAATANRSATAGGDAAARGAAMEEPAACGAATSHAAPAECRGGRRALVLARRRGPHVAPLESGGPGAAARAFRPGGLGPRPLRAPLGLGLPFRGLHPAGQACARLLRAAPALARPGHRLGQPVGGGRAPASRHRLRQRAAPNEAAYRQALDAELADMAAFLGVNSA